MGRFNQRTFVYVAAFGIFTDVSYGTPQTFKSAFGHLAYVLEGATKLGDLGRAYHLKVEYDGGTLEGDFLYGMVTNTNSVGGFKLFPPDQVSLDDGVFEVVLVRQPRNVADLQDTLLALVRQSAGSSSRVEAFHTRRLTVTASEPLPWTLDGEYGGDPEIAKIENLHKAITWCGGNEPPALQKGRPVRRPFSSLYRSPRLIWASRSARILGKRQRKTLPVTTEAAMSAAGSARKTASTLSESTMGSRRIRGIRRMTFPQQGQKEGDLGLVQCHKGLLAGALDAQHEHAGGVDPQGPDGDLHQGGVVVEDGHEEAGSSSMDRHTVVLKTKAQISISRKAFFTRSSWPEP